MRNIFCVCTALTLIFASTVQPSFAMGTEQCRNSGSTRASDIPEGARAIELTSVLSGLNRLRVYGRDVTDSAYDDAPLSGEIIAIPESWTEITVLPESYMMESSRVLCFRFV